MLWDEYCLIRLSVQYQGRQFLVWRVIRHGSNSVRFEVYQTMLKRDSSGSDWRSSLLSR